MTLDNILDPIFDWLDKHPFLYYDYQDKKIHLNLRLRKIQ